MNDETPKRGVQVFRDGALQKPADYDLQWRSKFDRKAKRMADKALKNLGKILEQSSNDLARVGAAKAIFERALGSPKKELTIDQTVRHEISYADMLRQLHAEMKEEQITHDTNIVDAEVVEIEKEPGGDDEDQ